MKRHIAVISMAVLLGLAWTGCSKKTDTAKSPDGTASTPGAGAGAGKTAAAMRTGPVDLKVKWVVGGRVIQDLDVRQVNETIVPMMPQPIKQEVNMGHQCGVTVLAENPDGSHDMEMEFLTTRMQVNARGQDVVNFDSTLESIDDTKNPLAVAFRRLVGAKLQFTLDTSNQVSKLDGYPDLMKKLTNGTRADTMNIAQSIFTEDYFKQLMGNGSKPPDKPLSPGESYPFHLDIPMGPTGKGALDFNVTFKDWEMHNKHQCARMELDGTITMTKGGKVNNNASLVAIENGKSTGTTWFDPEKGMVQETDINLEMTMILTTPMPAAARRNNPRTPNMSAGNTLYITNLFTQKVIVKLEDAGTLPK